MENRTHLFFEDFYEFEGTDCLPVTWLSLFDNDEYVVETSDESEERGGIVQMILSMFQSPQDTGPLQNFDTQQITLAAGYRTSQPDALERVELYIKKIRDHSPAWTFLQPLEILRDRLLACPEDATIVLDLTHFWVIDEENKRRSRDAVDEFAVMVNRLNGNAEHDLALIENLVQQFACDDCMSLNDLSPEECTPILIGAEGQKELYSRELVGDCF
jgi:hypothetical protein